MRKFKIGDKVRVIDSGGSGLAKVNDIGEVVGLWENLREFGIEIRVVERNINYSQFERRFELIKKKSLDLSHIKKYEVAKFLEQTNKEGI